MAKATLQIVPIPLSRIFLDLENPRHEDYRSEADVIEYLCSKEQVLSLARDIATNGLNPLESFALVPVKGSGRTKSTQSYTVAEGNRRLCALKLLVDSDLAPANLRKDFEKLAKEWTPLKTVRSVIFKNKDEVKLWLGRIHNGLQGGIGRKEWNAEQKQRFSGTNKNRSAQEILDYAEQNNLISAEDRKGKLTTVQRYLSNALFREAIGVDSSNPEGLTKTRPDDDFRVLTKRFVDDLLSGKVNSRTRKSDIDQYSREISSIALPDGSRIEPEPIPTGGTKAKRKSTRKTKPKQPGKAKNLPYEKDIKDLLDQVGSSKLNSLYYSICDVGLENHTPLVSVGVWSFFETLTARMGRTDGSSFESFLSKNKLQTLGVGDGKQTKAQRDAIERILAYGNTTKHHDTSAAFNGDQLANDMDTLKVLIIKCLEDVVANTTKS